MEKTSRLKPTQQIMVAFTLLLVAVIVVARLWFGPPGFYWAFGSIQFLMAFIHAVVMLRTRNPTYLLPTVFYLFVGLTFLPPLEDSPGHNIFAGLGAVTLAGFFVVLFSKRINWRYREILELAARPVQDASDGFTARPYPSGYAEFDRSDALGMARFLLRHVIAYPFYEEDRVVLVIPRYMWSYLLLGRRTYGRETYVTFADSGQVSVRMAQRDYQAYKEELTFDQLCASLGNLFKRFMTEYRTGKKHKIIERLNTV